VSLPADVWRRFSTQRSKNGVPTKNPEFSHSVAGSSTTTLSPVTRRDRVLLYENVACHPWPAGMMAAPGR
jgi:hypothetical protein